MVDDAGVAGVGVMRKAMWSLLQKGVVNGTVSKGAPARDFHLVLFPAFS